jgi:Cu+-exporting ATPase
LIPVDGILIEKAAIDYSFVTGEAVPIITKNSGDKYLQVENRLGKL